MFDILGTGKRTRVAGRSKNDLSDANMGQEAIQRLWRGKWKVPVRDRPNAARSKVSRCVHRVALASRSLAS